MQTVADLNALADAQAALYDGVALFTADPGLDGSNVAAGGEEQAVTFSAAGTEGPAAEHVAIDGGRWSSVVNFDLDDGVIATHFGLYAGGVFRRGELIAGGIKLGPGLVPFSFLLGPSA